MRIIYLIWISISMTMFLVLVNGCGSQNVSLESQEPKKIAEVLTVSMEELQPLVESYGYVMYSRKADITVLLEGRVEKLYFDEGDIIRANARAALLSNIQINIQVRKAEDAVEAAKAHVDLTQASYEEGFRQVESRILNIERKTIEIEQKKLEEEEAIRTMEHQKILFDAGGITEYTLRSVKLNHQFIAAALNKLIKEREIGLIGLRDEDIRKMNIAIPENPKERKNLLSDINTRRLLAERRMAEVRLTSAISSLESAQAVENALQIRSPLTGIVAKRFVEVGENVSSGDAIYSVYSANRFHVVFSVQESDSVLILKGRDVRVEIDAFPNRTFSATVEVVSPVVDSKSGNVTVRALLENTGESLRPGMFARVKVNVGEPRMSVVLPRSVFIERRDDSATVFLVRNGRAFRKNIKVGKRFGVQYEILENLTKGDLIINNPSSMLKDGESIQYRNQTTFDITAEGGEGL